MKTIYFLFFALCAITSEVRAQYAASNFTLVGHTDPETTFNGDSMKYSGCWGWYQADKKKEYAIACSHKGTYWIDITAPATPTVSAYRAGKLSGCTWREAKTYKNYCYVISDDWGSNSFQIFDMQYLPDSVHKVYDGNNIFRLGHTLWIDDDKLYVASVSAGSTYSSMCVYSLANPAAPVKLRALGDDYQFINQVHDMYVRRDTVYASCGYQGLYVFKFTGTAFTMLGSLTTYTYSGYNHSTALTPNGKTMVMADEVPASLPIKILDPTNLSNIQVLATANQFPKTTPHNPFIPNNELCFLSSYQDGLQLYNISNPSSPQLAGYFDTYPQGGGNVNNYPAGKTYSGQWGCYPFFPSGNVFALDRLNGAFVLRTHLYGGPHIPITSNIPSTACLGSTFASTVLAPGATSISWSAPGLGTSTATGNAATLSFSAAGVYSVVVTASHTGSTSTLVRTVTVTALQAAATVTNPTCISCVNGIIKVQPSGGIPPYSYSWTPSGGTTAIAKDLAAGCYTVTFKDSVGCKGSAQSCLTAPATGLSAISHARVRIYPNPADDKLFVNIAEHMTHYTVHNLLGVKVLEGSASAGTQALDVSAFPKGVYVLTLVSAAGSQAANFIVE